MSFRSKFLNGVMIAFASLLFIWNVHAAAGDDAYNQFVREVTMLRDSGQITSAERAKRMKVKFEQLNGPSDGLEQEYWAYFIFIASRRDQGMSLEEANYLITQKTNEINARRAQSNSAANEQNNAAKLIVYKRCWNKCMAEREGSYATTSVITYACESECRRYK